MPDLLRDRKLIAALDAAAPDSESWQRGYEVFYDEGYPSDEKALYAALDAAAPDSESWMKGFNAYTTWGALHSFGGKYATNLHSRLRAEGFEGLHNGFRF